MYSIYILYIYYICTIYILYIHYIHTIYILYIYTIHIYIYYICTIYIYTIYIYTIYIIYIYIHTIYIYTIYIMHHLNIYIIYIHVCTVHALSCTYIHHTVLVSFHYLKICWALRSKEVNVEVGVVILLKVMGLVEQMWHEAIRPQRFNEAHWMDDIDAIIGYKPSRVMESHGITVSNGYG